MPKSISNAQPFYREGIISSTNDYPGSHYRLFPTALDAARAWDATLSSFGLSTLVSSEASLSLSTHPPRRCGCHCHVGGSKKVESKQATVPLLAVAQTNASFRGSESKHAVAAVLVPTRAKPGLLSPYYGKGYYVVLKGKEVGIYGSW
jgi:hypothetical protein